MRENLHLASNLPFEELTNSSLTTMKKPETNYHIKVTRHVQ